MFTNRVLGDLAMHVLEYRNISEMPQIHDYIFFQSVFFVGRMRNVRRRCSDGLGMVSHLGSGFFPKEFCDHVKDLWRGAKALAIFKPKHHQLAHMISFFRSLGGPYTWGCWRDETGNMYLKAVARQAHRRVWHKRVLSEHRVAFGLMKKRVPSGGRSKRHRHRH